MTHVPSKYVLRRVEEIAVMPQFSHETHITPGSCVPFGSALSGLPSRSTPTVLVKFQHSNAPSASSVMLRELALTTGRLFGRPKHGDAKGASTG